MVFHLAKDSIKLGYISLSINSDGRIGSPSFRNYPAITIHTFSETRSAREGACGSATLGIVSHNGNDSDSKGSINNLSR